MLIAAALAISLIITAAPALRVSADPGLSEWDRVPTPSEDGFVVAANTTIIDYAVADDGEVAFAIVFNATNSKYLLLKSTDHAATWEDITDALVDELEDDGYTLDELLRVATDGVDPDFVAVALTVNEPVITNVHVYISSDGGATFKDTDEVEDTVFFASPADIADLAVSPEDDDERDIAIVGQDNNTNAVIFRCTVVGEFSTGWEDARYDGWDDDPDFATSPDPVSLWVTWVEFAPSWDADRTILVTTVADGTSTDEAVHLQCGTWGTAEGWNAESNVPIDMVLIDDNVDLPMWVASTDARGIAGLTTPLDYSGRNSDSRQLWVWVNYEITGETYATIYRVKNESVNPLGWQVEDEELWLTNVDYLGYISEGKAIAGVGGDGEGDYAECCKGVDVYRNDNIVGMDICCYDWEAACKPPTGRAAMAAFYVSDDPATSKAYAVAIRDHDTEYYDEGAWSVSFDDGDVWNQLSLIDTLIDYLSDVAVSPDCNKTMLVSVNLEGEIGCGCDSVWLHAENLPEADEYSGKWLRTWCDELVGYNDGAFLDFVAEDFPERGLLRLAPEETTGETVYLVDRMSDTVYWNEMETLACWDQGSATVDNIVDLAVKDSMTIYALDETGTVAMSDDYALGWHPAVDSLVGKGWTIVVWGDDILVGGQASDVSYSDDGGETFTELEDVAVANGYVTVAFDSYYDANDTIYAALACGGTDPDNGVYRWVIDESDAWYDLRAEPTTFQLTGSGSTTVTNEVNFTGLVLDNADGNPMSGPDTGGVLYASYVDTSRTITGVARHLTPAEDIVCRECGEWDYLIVGFTPGELFNMMPQALKICGCLTADSNSKLFAIDGSARYDRVDAETGTVWSFEDCFAKDAPDLTSPAEGATIAADPCTCFNVPFSLIWDRQCNACEYDIQIALDEGFTQVVTLGDIPDYLPPSGDDPSYPVSAILVCEFTYYWRVRSSKAETGQVIHSWWSEPRSLTIAPAAGAGVKLVAPEDGATDVAATDVSFSWSAVGSADKYDWKLSRNADLSAPIETKEGLTATACTYTGTALAYDTPYYWQVSALKEGSVISTSTIGTFRTMEEPPPPVDEDEIETPIWVWVVIAIGAALVIVVIVLIFRTRRV